MLYEREETQNEPGRESQTIGATVVEKTVHEMEGHRPRDEVAAWSVLWWRRCMCVQAERRANGGERSMR